jgi:hypothetical protein
MVLVRILMSKSEFEDEVLNMINIYNIKNLQPPLFRLLFLFTITTTRQVLGAFIFMSGAA